MILYSLKSTLSLESSSKADKSSSKKKKEKSLFKLYFTPCRKTMSSNSFFLILDFIKKHKTRVFIIRTNKHTLFYKNIWIFVEQHFFFILNFIQNIRVLIIRTSQFLLKTINIPAYFVFFRLESLSFILDQFCFFYKNMPSVRL